MNDLNQISSAFLLMTSSMALASTIRWVRSSYSRMTTCILLDLSHWKFWYIKDFCNLNRTVLAPTWRIWNLFKIFAQNPPLLPLFSRGAGRISTNLLDALAQSQPFSSSVVVMWMSFCLLEMSFSLSEMSFCLFDALFFVYFDNFVMIYKQLMKISKCRVLLMTFRLLPCQFCDQDAHN